MVNPWQLLHPQRKSVEYRLEFVYITSKFTQYLQPKFLLNTISETSDYQHLCDFSSRKTIILLNNKRTSFSSKHKKTTIPSRDSKILIKVWYKKPGFGPLTWNGKLKRPLTGNSPWDTYHRLLHGIQGLLQRR